MRIRLEALSPAAVVVAAADATTYLVAASNRDVVAAYVREVAKGQRALYERTGAVPPWIGYLAHDAESGDVLGSCSFIVGSDPHSIEIAYYTFPLYEGRGAGHAMAQDLVRIARESGDMTRVYAHTLPEPNASTRILTRLGFTQTGQAVDDDAGPVWRWEIVL